MHSAVYKYIYVFSAFSIPSFYLSLSLPFSLLYMCTLSYYQLEETDSTSVNSYLSKTVETSLSALQASHCIEVEEDDRTLQPLSLGCIASYYYLHHTTVRLFSEKLQPQSSFEDLLLLLSVSGIYMYIPCIYMYMYTI